MLLEKISQAVKAPAEIGMTETANQAAAAAAEAASPAAVLDQEVQTTAPTAPPDDAKTVAIPVATEEAQIDTPVAEQPETEVKS